MSIGYRISNDEFKTVKLEEHSNAMVDVSKAFLVRIEKNAPGKLLEKTYKKDLIYATGN